MPNVLRTFFSHIQYTRRCRTETLSFQARMAQLEGLASSQTLSLLFLMPHSGPLSIQKAQREAMELITVVVQCQPLEDSSHHMLFTQRAAPLSHSVHLLPPRQAPALTHCTVLSPLPPPLPPIASHTPFNTEKSGGYTLLLACFVFCFWFKFER